MLRRRTCRNTPDSFCYICGEFTFARHREKISLIVKKAYKHYFGMELGDQDKNWAPHICCATCYVNFINWWICKGNSMLFAAPMSWREPKDHKHIVYPNLPPAIRPVPHSVNHPVSSRPAHEEIETGSEDSVGEEFPSSEGTDHTYQVKCTSSPYFVTQMYLSDLVRDLGLNPGCKNVIFTQIQMLHFASIEKALFFHIIRLTTH
ncbi:hypothetical protein PR048_013776 [Dryococelus australis]|uniref:Uncharacterized protein n=1 Tax=Dryococelus australis TaxID=614101 RepID=A0ABQ9HTY2_9NEOP|nr:hypothetical protein PR048_013776 [Dryococelus australis]